MYFYSIGGGDKIGGSSYFLKLGEKRFLLDMGLDPNLPGIYPKYENLFREKLLSTMGDLDGVLISHAHLDHIGSLPYILGEGRDVEIYGSKETKILGERIMLSAPKESDDCIEIFKGEEIREAVSKMRTEEIIEKDGYRISFYDSNHILGSKMVEIEHGDERVLYTGDFSLKEMITCKKIDFSKIRTPDILLCEGTNLGKKSNYIGERLAFIRHANRVISRGGTLLIPAFAFGRAQEVLYLLRNAMRNSLLKKVPIYVDGLASDICKLYGELGLPIPDDGILRAPWNFHKKMDDTPKIIVASSGMLLENSASWLYAQALQKDERNSITFVGYQAKNTPGFKYLHYHSQNLQGMISKFDLSAHGDESEIFKLIDILKPKKVVFLHRNLTFKESRV